MLSEKEQRTAERIIMAIGVISILIGAMMIFLQTFSDSILVKESKGIIIGHSALMIGGIIMLLRLPMHPLVDVGPELDTMNRNYGAIYTAIVSVGMCFLLWGLYSMVALGFTGKKMFCFLLGVIPLTSVLVGNSRNIDCISLMWKISMSLGIGTMLIPLAIDNLTPFRLLFIVLTIVGLLLCIALVHINDPYLEPYLRAREEAIASKESRFRNNGFYIVSTVAVSFTGALMLILLLLDPTMKMIYIPPEFFGLDPVKLMRLFLMIGCIIGGMLGWHLAYCYLRDRCFDSSKFFFTIMSSMMFEVIGLLLIFALAMYGRCFEMIILGTVLSAGFFVMAGRRCMKKREETA